MTTDSHQAKVRAFWRQTAPLLALLAMVVSFGLAWALVEEFGANAFAIDWRLSATCCSVVMTIVTILMLYPQRD